uniref:F5/8 type C domain-containing protein n=1 Tax=Sinocyclocheilus grahami TaxID=75366 RepID=A0A672LNE7_SINGR
PGFYGSYSIRIWSLSQGGKSNLDTLDKTAEWPLSFSFVSDAPCSELQGMLSGLLPDSQISASSVRDLHWAPGAARLVASRSGWFPGPAQPLAMASWLQVDLGTPKTVRGVITQGARRGNQLTSSENRAFVRKYRLAHSLNGKDWNFVMDSKTSMPKVVNLSRRLISKTVRNLTNPKVLNGSVSSLLLFHDLL